jgi:hypothetical protein
MTPEGKTKTRIKKALNECGAWYYMPVQTGYGNTHLDFICARGDTRELFFIEAKRHGEGPTERQGDIIIRERKAGFTVFVIDDESDKLIPKHDSIMKLKEWLTTKP